MWTVLATAVLVIAGYFVYKKYNEYYEDYEEYEEGEIC
jgi:hypothetical protein